MRCPYCEYVCANENPDLKVHMRRRHLPQSQGKDGLPLSCQECGFIANTKKDLKQHEKFHKKGPELKFYCTTCSFVTDCESRLKRHQYIHTKHKPYACTICDYRGTQKEHVIRHMKSRHNIVVQFTGSRRRKEDILPHLDKKTVGLVRLVNEDGENRLVLVEKEKEKKKYEPSDFTSKEKLFACNHCTMKFAKLINLYKHLHGQHQAVTPLEDGVEMSCIACEYKTVRKRNMLVHMRKHSFMLGSVAAPSTGPVHMFSCMLCDYKNVVRETLYEHMKVKHALKIEVKPNGSTMYVVKKPSDLPTIPQKIIQNVEALRFQEHTEQVETNEDTEDDIETKVLPSSGTHFSVVESNEMPADVSEEVTVDKFVVETPNKSEPQEVVIQFSKDEMGKLNLTKPELNNTENVDQFVVGNVQNVISVKQDVQAAQAVEGLQALARQGQGQVGVSQKSEGSVTGKPVAPHADIQLSDAQLQNLSSGDYIEIDGEMYKVEFASRS